MRAQRTAGTSAEMAVRRALYARGYRYRVDFKLLPGERFRGDIVLTRHKVAVFLDGCFWHGCPAHGTIPKSNTQWWVDKIEGNRQRDQRASQLLVQAGWQVLRFWEHEPTDSIVTTIEHRLHRCESASADGASRAAR